MSSARAHRMAAKTQSVSQLALKHLLPTFGPKLLCDITPQDITDYQRIRLRAGAQGRTVNIEIATLRQVLKAGDLWQPLMGKVKMLHVSSCAPNCAPSLSGLSQQAGFLCAVHAENRFYWLPIAFCDDSGGQQCAPKRFV